MKGVAAQQNLRAEQPAAEDPVHLSQVKRHRKRNRVVAAQKRTRAIELIAAGHTYEQVAQRLGYQNRGTVHHIVHGALAKHEASAAEEMRLVATARLDALLNAVWELAMSGDVPANNAAMKVILTQCRLMGLIDHKSPKRAEKLRTVVLSVDEAAEMMAALH